MGFNQPLYEVEEGNFVAVCAETDGELRRTVFIYLTSQDEIAIGENKKVLRHTYIHDINVSLVMENFCP